MAARTFFYGESLSRTTTTTTNFSAVKVSQAFLPNANKTYAIFWSAIMDVSSGSNGHKSRLQNTTAVVTLGGNFQENVNTTYATNKNTHGGVALYTAGASPATQTIEIQYAAGGASTTVGIQEAAILILELIDSVDQWASSTGVSNTTSTSYATKVSKTWTPATSGNYLFFTSGEVQFVTADPRARLNVNSGTICNLHNRCYDGSANNWYPYIAAARMVGISGSNTAALEYSIVDPGTGSIQNAYCVALRMDQFDTYFWAEDRVGHTTTSATYADSATTGAVTPAAQTYAVLALGDSTTNGGSPTTSVGFKINGAGLDVGTGFNQPMGLINFAWSSFQVRNATLAASSQTWKTQYARTAGADTGTSDENVIAIMQVQSASTPLDVSPTGYSNTTTRGSVPIVVTIGF